jgi:hypothetical protein
MHMHDKGVEAIEAMKKVNESKKEVAKWLTEPTKALKCHLIQ